MPQKEDTPPQWKEAATRKPALQAQPGHLPTLQTCVQRLYDRGDRRPGAAALWGCPADERRAGLFALRLDLLLAPEKGYPEGCVEYGHRLW